MDVLVQQLEVAIREPNDHERGVGLLSLLSELTQRMGGLKVLTCDSGVYRCQAALTLEEVQQQQQQSGYTCARCSQWMKAA